MRIINRPKESNVERIFHEISESQDPDVDALYRLLHTSPASGLNERFSAFAPSIALSRGGSELTWEKKRMIIYTGTYAPWNSQNTLFSRKAFFGMFLPTTVAFRVTDIWRSYFVQVHY